MWISARTALGLLVAMVATLMAFLLPVVNAALPHSHARAKHTVPDAATPAPDPTLADVVARAERVRAQAMKAGVAGTLAPGAAVDPESGKVACGAAIEPDGPSTDMVRDLILQGPITPRAASGQAAQPSFVFRFRKGDEYVDALVSLSTDTIVVRKNGTLLGIVDAKAKHNELASFATRLAPPTR